MLTCDNPGYTFRYLRRAATVRDFQPFVGFGRLDRTYTSPTLFPLFTHRIIRPSRPDYPRFLRALWLDDGASDWAVLARSQGQREGDGIRVLMEPEVRTDGTTRTIFLVHGVRHRLRDPDVETALARLGRGDRLRLVDEPDNPVDGRAVLVSSDGTTMLGWVPTVLLPYVHHVRRSEPPVATVLQSSGADVPPAYRLLIELSGRTEAGYRPFDGPEWELFAD